jgi:hypothetical protein
MDGPASERLTTPEFIEALKTTLANARDEGEPYQSLAEKHLAALEVILNQITHERALTISAIERTSSDLGLLERRCDVLMHKHASEIWEGLGCPDYDPIYNILFPSSLPDPESHDGFAGRLSLVAELLKNHVHPRIDVAQAEVAAAELEAIATQFDQISYVLRKHQMRARVLDGLEASVARTGLLELSSLRRALRSLGLDDTRIKSVVPPPVSSRRNPGNKNSG